MVLNNAFYGLLGKTFTFPHIKSTYIYIAEFEYKSKENEVDLFVKNIHVCILGIILGFLTCKTLYPQPK